MEHTNNVESTGKQAGLESDRIIFLWYALVVLLFLATAAWYSQQLQTGIERSLALETHASSAQLGYLRVELEHLHKAVRDMSGSIELDGKVGHSFDLALARTNNLVRIGKAFPEFELTALESLSELLDVLNQELFSRETKNLDKIPELERRLSAAEVLVNQLYTRFSAKTINTIRQQSDLIEGYQWTMGVILVLLAGASLVIFWLLTKQRRMLYASRKELEQQVRERTKQLSVAKGLAEEASKAKSDFLARMSHELRTPLNAIIGITEMLHEDAEEEKRSDQSESLYRVLNASEHLLALINDILDLSKIEAGKMELDFSEFSILSMLNDVISTGNALAGVNKNKLELECQEEIGRMTGDEIRVRQILYNLLSNACKFTEKGLVKLGAQRYRDQGREWLRFDVSDTGIGIAPDLKKRIFREFVQGDRAIGRRHAGTGLGLAICRRMVFLMGGKIELESSVHQGSVFTVVLPTHRETESVELPDLD